MSKLSIKKDYIFVEKCNWNFWTPYLRTDIALSNFTLYNVVDGVDNVVYGVDNVIYIGI